MNQRMITCIMAGLLLIGGLPSYSKEKQGANIELPLSRVVNFYLTKIGAPIYLPKPHKISSTDVNKVAMALGMVSTDSIVALKNKDKEKFKEYSQLIYTYAKRLNVKNDILDVYPEIKKNLDKNEFHVLEQLIEKMRDQIVLEMNKSYRKDQANLAYIAAWIEGLYLVTQTLENKYNAKSAKLLHRQSIFKNITVRMKGLHPNIKKRSDVNAILKGLPRMQLVMKKKNLSIEDVKTLKSICFSLRQHMLLR